MQVKAVIVAALVSSVSAQADRPLPRHTGAAVARATGASGDPSCIASVASIEAAAPTIPSDLLVYESNLSLDLDNVCSLTVPASLQSDFSTYISGLESWSSKYASPLNSLLSKCSFTSPPDLLPTCILDTSKAGSGSGSGSGSGASSNTKNASPKETGMMAAAIAAAGFIGAVAAM